MKIKLIFKIMDLLPPWVIYFAAVRLGRHYEEVTGKPVNTARLSRAAALWDVEYGPF